MSCFPEKGADLRGSPGNFRGTSGELLGKSGKLPGNPWIAVKFHSERTSGEVAEKLPGKFWGTSGEVRGLSRSSGEPYPLPATRHICLQFQCEKRITPFLNNPLPAFRDSRNANWLRGSTLQFPNAVVLNAVGRRNTQMRAKERKGVQTQVRKRAQKGTKARKRVQKSGEFQRAQMRAKERKTERFRVSPQKSAKGRKRAQKKSAFA